MSVDDKHRSGRSFASRTDEIVEKIREIIPGDRR